MPIQAGREEERERKEAFGLVKNERRMEEFGHRVSTLEEEEREEGVKKC